MLLLSGRGEVCLSFCFGFFFFKFFLNSWPQWWNMASSSAGYLCIAWELSRIGFISLNTHLFLRYNTAWLKNPGVLSQCYSLLCVPLSCALISKLNTSDLFSLFPSVDLFMPLIIFISCFWNSYFSVLFTTQRRLQTAVSLCVCVLGGPFSSASLSVLPISLGSVLQPFLTVPSNPNDFSHCKRRLQNPSFICINLISN